MLSDEQRKKLAHFMGWEKEIRLDCPSCWVMPNGDPVIVCDAWLNPPSWSEAGTLIDQAIEKKHIPDISYVDKDSFAARHSKNPPEESYWYCLLSYHPGSWPFKTDYVEGNGATLPEAVVAAILAMLEVGDG